MERRKNTSGSNYFHIRRDSKKNESVKFGIKTEEPKPGINWKALDENGRQIESGKSLPGEKQDSAYSSSEETSEGIMKNLQKMIKDC